MHEAPERRYNVGESPTSGRVERRSCDLNSAMISGARLAPIPCANERTTVMTASTRARLTGEQGRRAEADGRAHS